jgi:hypothetical protein
MPRRDYHPSAIPGQHTVEEVITHIKGLFGVHDVHVDNERGTLVVHVSNLPGSSVQ